MTRYQKTMSQALLEVRSMTENSISKLKNGVKVYGDALPNRAVAQKKCEKVNREMGHDCDVYQSPFNNRFYVRIKEEKEKELDQEFLDDLANNTPNEEQFDEMFSDAQIAKLKKEYEPLRGKKISVDNANKLGAMFTKFDSNKNALEKLYGGDIPFVSTMAMTRLMTKHNYKASDLNKIKKEELDVELDVLEEANLLSEAEATIVVADKKKQDNLVHLCKQVGIRTTVKGDKVHLKGVFRRVMDISLAMQKNGLKVENMFEAKEEDKEEEKKKKDASTIDQDEVKEKTEDKGEDKEKLKAEIEKKDAEIQSLKVKAETEKAKVTKKETEKMVNPETGEPLLQVGIAYKHLRDKMKKEKQEVKESTDAEKSKAYAIGMSVAKKKMNDEPPLEKKTITKGHEIAKSILKKEETILEYSSQQIKQAYGIANDPRYKGGNYDGAVKTIEKIAKGLSNHPDVKKVLQRTNEQLEEGYEKVVLNTLKKAGITGAYFSGGRLIVSKSDMADAKKAIQDEPDIIKAPTMVAEQIEEGKMSAISAMQDAGKSAVEIAKALKLPLSAVKTILGEAHPAKEIYESIAAVKKKAEKTGMPYSILKKVYDRGMAAWRGGHRPGATQVQWALARVNSFVTKSSGTWGGADKDLAAKVKGEQNEQ